MTKTEESSRTSDPFEMWRQMYDANEQAWTAALEQTMGTPEFADSSGKLLETMLAAQKLVRDNMRVHLETMNVPTREDIARLGELVVGLEEKIDQIADRLDAIEGALRRAPSEPGKPAKPAAPAARAAKPPTEPARPATKPTKTARRAKPARPAKSGTPAKGIAE